MNRLGLGPAGEHESIADPRRAVVRSLAETAKPDGDLPFRARQYPGPVDPVIGVLVLDDRLFP
jgi:hypothetical protein